MNNKGFTLIEVLSSLVLVSIIIYCVLISLNTTMSASKEETYKLMKNNVKCNRWLAVIVLLVLLLCFVIFTYHTPHIGLFRDPVSGIYGIS